MFPGFSRFQKGCVKGSCLLVCDSIGGGGFFQDKEYLLFQHKKLPLSRTSLAFCTNQFFQDMP